MAPKLPFFFDSDLVFLDAAMEALSKIRRILRWSYVWAFLTKSTKKHFFEDQQGTLEVQCGNKQTHTHTAYRDTRIHGETDTYHTRNPKYTTFETSYTKPKTHRIPDKHTPCSSYIVSSIVPAVLRHAFVARKRHTAHVHVRRSRSGKSNQKMMQKPIIG